MTELEIGEIRNTLLEKIDLTRELSNEEIYTLIDNEIIETGKRQFISLNEKEKLRKSLFYSLRGFDILQELIEDESITEVMINGYDCLL